MKFYHGTNNIFDKFDSKYLQSRTIDTVCPDDMIAISRKAINLYNGDYTEFIFWDIDFINSHLISN